MHGLGTSAATVDMVALHIRGLLEQGTPGFIIPEVVAILRLMNRADQARVAAYAVRSGIDSAVMQEYVDTAGVQAGGVSRGSLVALGASLFVLAIGGGLWWASRGGRRTWN